MEENIEKHRNFEKIFSHFYDFLETKNDSIIISKNDTSDD